MLLSLWSNSRLGCSRAGLPPPPICRYICTQLLPNPVVSKWSRLAYYLKARRVFFNPDHFDWFGLKKDCTCSYTCRYRPHSSGDSAQPLWARFGFKAFEPSSAASQAAHLATAADIVQEKNGIWGCSQCHRWTTECKKLGYDTWETPLSFGFHYHNKKKNAGTNGLHFSTKFFILG